MMMQLSLLSRTTSISNSFQPITDSSSSTSLVGDASRPRATICSNSSRLYAMPPPVPPSVNDGRITVGKPISACTGERFLHAVRDLRARAFEADLAHRVAEALAVLGHVDRFARCGDQLDAVLLEHALAHQVERAVERGLAAHRRQQRVGALLRR